MVSMADEEEVELEVDQVDAGDADDHVAPQDHAPVQDAVHQLHEADPFVQREEVIRHLSPSMNR
jgi:hypothetical protein